MKELSTAFLWGAGLTCGYLFATTVAGVVLDLSRAFFTPIIKALRE